jgi:hypothetical protein
MGIFRCLSYDLESKAPEKKTIVVWGASGSVGNLAVQLAELVGLRVIAVAGTGAPVAKIDDSLSRRSPSPKRRRSYDSRSRSQSPRQKSPQDSSQSPLSPVPVTPDEEPQIERSRSCGPKNASSKSSS